MQKLLREYLDERNSKRRKNMRAGVAMLLLAVMVIGCVAGALSQYGVAMTGNAKCGMEEHQHTAECYTSWSAAWRRARTTYIRKPAA